jgi:DNA-binding Lrp family transcriptional regulator
MELSELDKAILAELTLDPFASNAAVADKLGVPTSRVAARLRTLERNGVSQVLAVLDHDHLGQSFCFVHIQVRDRPVADVATEICSHRLVLMVNELLDGAADLLVLVRFADVHSLHTVLGDLARVAGVARWRIDIVTDVPVFRSEYVTYGQGHQPLSIEQNLEYLEQDVPKGMCDETDRLIIAHLQQNAHQSINTVARKLGLKPSTARYRINNLKASEILRFIRVIDKSSVGIDRFTLVELSVDLRRIDTIVEALRDKEWLPQLFRSIGGADFLAIALTTGVDEILRVKREELLTIEGIIEVKLSSLHKNHKTDYRWAQRTTG